MVNSTIKASEDSEYKPTAWELLADSIHQAKMKGKQTRDEEEKKEEVEEKTLTVKEKMEIAEMNERERALCYHDKRS